MNLRNVSVYITTRTLKRLGLVLKLYPQNSEGEAVSMEGRNMTRDELADTLINQGIAGQYPAVLDLEKELTQTEHNFLKAYHGAEILGEKQKTT